LKKTPKVSAVPAGHPVDLPYLLLLIERRGISYRALANHLGIDRGHLQRVLSGERPGSENLLRSLAEAVEGNYGRRGQEDVARLIDAAVHVFFLRRGRFQSEVWRAPGPRHFPEKGGRS
jgi:transcriptional regulator with XRE-family HTH domain